MSESQNTKTGRPSDYTMEVAEHICVELATGRSLRSICQDTGMPHISTVMRWVLNMDGFREQYTRAREMQAEILVDEIIDIADNKAVAGIEPEGDTISTQKGDFPNKEWMQRSALRIDARKWYAGKVLPKKYGTKSVDLTSGGERLQGIQIFDI